MRKFILKGLYHYSRGTFADIVYRNALLHPDDEAFICDPQKITSAQFNARVSSLIHALCLLWVRKGDGIGILSWNCLEYADAYGVAMKGEFIASPFNFRLHKEELEHLVKYSEATMLFVNPELWLTINSLRSHRPGAKRYICFGGASPDMLSHQELLARHPSDEPEVKMSKDDPILIFYTSGTLGTPSGAICSHYRKLYNTRIEARFALM